VCHRLDVAVSLMQGTLGSGWKDSSFLQRGLWPWFTSPVPVSALAIFTAGSITKIGLLNGRRIVFYIAVSSW
jgi:hypothetical protein